MNEQEAKFYSALVRWICLTVITLITTIAAYNIAVDVKWEPKMEQRYIHAHGGN